MSKAIEVAEERYARGEISKEELNEILKNLNQTANFEQKSGQSATDSPKKQDDDVPKTYATGAAILVGIGFAVCISESVVTGAVMIVLGVVVYIIPSLKK